MGFPAATRFVKCDNCRKTNPLLNWGADGDGKVSCRECGILRVRLAGHLQAAHALSEEEYLTKHPDALLFAPQTRSLISRANQSNAAKKRWGDPVALAAQGDLMRRIRPNGPLSESHKTAISKSGKGAKHKMTDAGRKTIGDNGRKQLKHIRENPDYGKEQSARMKTRAEKDPLLGMRNPETQKKSLETRIRNGTLIPQGGGRGITGFRQGIPHYCRSAFEANMARILIAAKVAYEYEPQLFQLPSGVKWTPDFRLLEPLGEHLPSGWLECKGWRRPDGTAPGLAADKIQEFESSVGKSVFLLCQSDPLWQLLETQWKPQIPSWEHPRKNLRTHPALFARKSETD